MGKYGEICSKMLLKLSHLKLKTAILTVDADKNCNFDSWDLKTNAIKFTLKNHLKFETNIFHALTNLMYESVLNYISSEKVI